MLPYRKEQIRDFNSRLLLEHILQKGPVSRAALAKESGLTKATVSAIVQELIQCRLVTEIGSEDTTLGRKPILLSFCAKSGYVISVDVGPAVISALAADLSGCVELYQQIITPSASLLAESLTELIDGLSETLHRGMPEAVHGLCGITLGIHGVTCRDEVVFAPHYPADTAAILGELKKSFPVPIFLENEANLAVMGERAFLSRSHQNIVDLSIHAGVGLGLYLDGNLFTGHSGYAGEFGHTILYPNGRPCACGQCGCLEQYLSEPALLADYAALSGQRAPQMSDFFLALQEGSQTARSALSQYLKTLELCLTNIDHAYDPELIILTSTLFSAFPDLLEPLRQTRSQKKGCCPLSISTLNERASLYGGIYKAVLSYLGVRFLRFRAPDEKD